MPDGSGDLIIPTVTPTGVLHFVQVPKDASGHQVVTALLSIEGLKEEILGDLEEVGWALQKARSERAGRTWEEDELLALGDGQYGCESLLTILFTTSPSRYHPAGHPHSTSYRCTRPTIRGIESTFLCLSTHQSPA